MGIKFRKAGLKELGTLLDLRMQFIRDMHPEYPQSRLKTIRKASPVYFMEILSRKAYIGFIGSLQGGEIACSAGLLLYSLPPLNSGKSRKIGHMLNFFTRPAFRKKGYGMKLMQYMKKSAEKMWLNRLVLNSTKMRYPLYRKTGFLLPGGTAMKLYL